MKAVPLGGAFVCMKTEETGDVFAYKVGWNWDGSTLVAIPLLRGESIMKGKEDKDGKGYLFMIDSPLNNGIATRVEPSQFHPTLYAKTSPVSSVFIQTKAPPNGTAFIVTGSRELILFASPLF
jgi:hypothetical protein